MFEEPDISSVPSLVAKCKKLESAHSQGVPMACRMSQMPHGDGKGNPSGETSGYKTLTQNKEAPANLKAFDANSPWYLQIKL
ncbi:hypothetical protein N7454_010298 [Penicillium verhagenii]|nr:hypothetical protein N7454_010298 [Penicillium verhagenii]